MDKLAKVWNVEDVLKRGIRTPTEAVKDEERESFAGHTGYVTAVAFTPDDKIVISGSQDHTARLWDVATGRALVTLSGHTDAIVTLALSPDGKILATGSHDHTVRLWDMPSGQERTTLRGHTNVVQAVAYAPDGKTIASGGYDRTIKIWDVASAKELATLVGHTGGVEGWPTLPIIASSRRPASTVPSSSGILLPGAR